jgi:protein-L-isoaspartate(D-aspartate) O-methyltransferase
MVDLIVSAGVRDSATLSAMRAVPRHEFVPADVRDLAYGDHPLPIGYEQTISQPYVVAFMTEQLRARPGMNVLEVGTGSGYQAAVLAEIGCDVYTIEIVEPLAVTAAATLARLGYDRVHVRHGDGYRGWPEEAPFDAVIVTAAADEIPPKLLEQLAPRGRLVMPVGPRDGVQYLMLVEKAASGRTTQRTLLPVRFVPLIEGK